MACLWLNVQASVLFRLHVNENPRQRSSVADPFHFDRDPDPFLDSDPTLKRKKKLFLTPFFLLITKK